MRRGVGGGDIMGGDWEHAGPWGRIFMSWKGPSFASPSGHFQVGSCSSQFGVTVGSHHVLVTVNPLSGDFRHFRGGSFRSLSFGSEGFQVTLENVFSESRTFLEGVFLTASWCAPSVVSRTC